MGSPIKHAKFYWLATRVLDWFRDHKFPPPSHPLVTILVAPLLIAGAGIWLKADLSAASVAAVLMAILLQAFVGYLAAAEKAIDEAAKQSALDQFILFNKMAAGNVGAVLDTFWRRHRRRTEAQTSDGEYLASLQSRQQQLLSHAARIIRRQIGSELADDAITANWCLRGLGEHENSFRVEVYDRDMHDRKADPDGWKPIRDSLPGASAAFLTGDITLVPDTHELPNIFSDKNAYRSILSVPVKVESRVLGVMNLDARDVDILNTEHGELVLDVAYLIGFCEILRRKGEQQA